MKSPRQICVIAHRYAGLFLIPWLFLVSLSGSIIAFNDELRRGLNPELFYVLPQGNRLSVDAIAAKIYERYPSLKISYFAIDQGIDEGRGSYEVYLAPRASLAENARKSIDFDVMHINPYTGEELGRYQSDAVTFDRRVLTNIVYAIHEHLLGNAFGPAVEGWATSFLGVIALIWIVDTAIAAYISLPRTGPWRKMLSVKWSSSTYRLSFDLHRASGVLLVALFLMLAVSGAYWSADFGATQPVKDAIETILPPAGDPVEARPARQTEMDRPAISYGDAIGLARRELDRQNASYGTIWDFWPDDIKGVIYVEHRLPDGTFGPRGPVVAIDADTGVVVATYLTPQSGMRAGNNVDNWMYALHSGRILGFWGRVLIGLSGIFCCLLCITGFVIWRKKAAAARLSRSRSAAREISSPVPGSR